MPKMSPGDLRALLAAEKADALSPPCRPPFICKSRAVSKAAGAKPCLYGANILGTRRFSGKSAVALAPNRCILRASDDYEAQDKSGRISLKFERLAPRRRSHRRAMWNFLLADVTRLTYNFCTLHTCAEITHPADIPAAGLACAELGADRADKRIANINRESSLMTDEWKVYAKLGEEFASVPTSMVRLRLAR